MRKMTSPGGESKAFTFFRQLFFLGSIALLTAGLGWNWGYHAKYREGTGHSRLDFLMWCIVYAAWTKSPMEIHVALWRPRHTCKSNRWSIFQLACCANDVWILSTKCHCSRSFSFFYFSLGRWHSRVSR